MKPTTAEFYSVVVSREQPSNARNGTKSISPLGNQRGLPMPASSEYNSRDRPSCTETANRTHRRRFPTSNLEKVIVRPSGDQVGPGSPGDKKFASWATLALTVGVSPKVVSEQLGHTSAAFTLDVYSHVLPHMQDDAAAKVESALLG